VNPDDPCGVWQIRFDCKCTVANFAAEHAEAQVFVLKKILCSRPSCIEVLLTPAGPEQQGGNGPAMRPRDPGNAAVMLSLRSREWN
jgi:hypothetical protein